MNLYFKELKTYRKSLFIWSFFIFLLILMGMQDYAVINSSGGSEYMKIMESLPQGLQAIFGMTKLDLTKVVDYFAIVYLYLVLMVSIHGAMLGNNIISKEEKDKTAEFLMVKPISRYAILTSKLFTTFGFVMACISKKANKSGSIVMFTLLTTYFLSMIIDMKKELSVLTIFTPFKYFDAKNIIPTSSLNIYYVVLTVILSFIMIIIGYKYYANRDLNI